MPTENNGITPVEIDLTALGYQVRINFNCHRSRPLNSQEQRSL